MEFESFSCSLLLHQLWCHAGSASCKCYSV